jgi:hypothetical protein
LAATAVKRHDGGTELHGFGSKSFRVAFLDLSQDVDEAVARISIGWNGAYDGRTDALHGHRLKCHPGENDPDLAEQ